MKNVLCYIVLFLCCISVKGQDFFEKQRDGWLDKAELYKPKLVTTTKYPKQIVKMEKDQNAYQGWKTIPAGEVEKLYKSSFKDNAGVIVDFGEHMTGHFSFSLSPFSGVPDAPARFKFTFGEVPSEIMTSFDLFPTGGSLSRAWLQDETVTATAVPSTITIPRRLSFRYVKIELVGAPNYDFSISKMSCDAVTSASNRPDELPESVDPIIRNIDKVGMNTLKECMQTVYEDGPKRDQRLWIGDLYLESLGNNYSFKQFDLTKRCFYLLAGLSSEEGYLMGCVYENMDLRPYQNLFLYEYGLLFGVTLKDYLLASEDRQTVEELWPVAKKQLDIVRKYLKDDGMMDFEKANREWWIFFDWKDGLYKEAAFQGFNIFALKNTYELAKLLGKEKEVSDLPALIKRMTSAAKKNMYDKKTGLFVGTKDKQVSYASQLWMILGGVPTKQEGQKALKALLTTPDVCRPGTPYLYHYYIESLIECGLKEEAKAAVIDYWGGMVQKGADTFWEAYDPQNDYITPYNFHPMNSYCHAWSCTPVYFIRKYPDIFQ